jgi:4-alpha-glucanotransferase
VTRRPRLRALARRLGILPAYYDMHGKLRRTTDDARAAVLDAMGYDTSSEDTATLALAAIDDRERRRLVTPVRVLRGTRPPGSLTVAIPADLAGPIEWRIEVVDESGRTTRHAGRRAGAARAARLPFPARIRGGYATVRVFLRGRGPDRTDEQLVVVPPASCYSVAQALGGRRAFGLMANLYTVRSGTNWGAGDLGDLTRLCAWAARRHADFVGVNPLHALRNRAGSESPYAPVSRLFRNPLYLDVTAIPELASCEPARRLLAAPAFRDELSRLRAGDRVSYEQVMGLKRRVLDLLHAGFVTRHGGGRTARGRAYGKYVAGEGEALTDFATFAALEEHLADTRPALRADSSDWPVDYRDPRSARVRRFRDENPHAIDFHRYLQFELDRQLSEAAAAADAGMRLGLLGDLAIGSASAGSDRWSFQDLFVTGLEIGAPPDDFAPEGQAWGLPPLHPVRLQERRFDYWIRLVRAAVRHYGALRIDHVMGLFRQFCIPRGRSGTEGAYIRFPADELLAILAVESERHRTVIVGEDLGTVPMGFANVLRRWGILSTKVLYFERGPGGAFNPASRYSRRALVTANTHDQAPLAGFVTGRDLVLRRMAGALPSDEALSRAVAERERDRRRLIERLARAGALDPRDATSEAALVQAVYRFLATTPAPLLGLSLDDLAGERDPVNLPGVPQHQHPSWTRRMGRTLEELAGDAAIGRLLDDVAARTSEK